MTFEDILKLPAAVIGALAVLAASAISAFMVMLTALVNTRSARRTARDSFRRDLLSRNFQPFTNRLDEQIAILARFQRVLVDTRKTLVDLPCVNGSERTGRTTDMLTELMSLKRAFEDDGAMWVETSGLTVLYRDQRLIDLTARWVQRRRECLELLGSEGSKPASSEMALERMSEAVFQTNNEAVLLRIAIEESIIDPPNWMSRTLYAMTRWARKNVT